MYNLCTCMPVKLRHLLMCYCHDEVFNMYMFWGLYFLFIHMYVSYYITLFDIYMYFKVRHFMVYLCF